MHLTILHVTKHLFDFQDVSHFKREDYLQQYYRFECRCIPCSFDWPLSRDMTKSVAKKGMSAKANEIKMAYANTHKLTVHDIQVCILLHIKNVILRNVNLLILNSPFCP